MKSRSNSWNRLIVAVLGLAVGASVASAQIAVENAGVNYDSDSGAGVNTLASFSVGAGDDRKLVVAINSENAGTITGITYGGVALTNVVKTGTSRIAEIWYLDNPAVGTADVVATFSGNARSRMGVLSLQHAKPGFSVQNATTGSINITLTTEAFNTFVVGCYTENNGAPAITSGPFATTLYSGDGGSCKTDAGYQNEAVAGAKDYAWDAALVGGSGIAVAGFESFDYVPPTPPYLTPYADDYTTLGLWHMETIRSAKYMDDDDSNTPGRDANWQLQPSETNAPPMVSVVDPSTNSIGYPAGNADFSNCMYFPGIAGTGAILANGNVPDFDITNVRLEGWCKEDGTENDPKPILFDRWNQVVFYLTDTGFQLLAFEGSGDNNWYSINPAGFSTTNWNHWAVEFSEQNAKVYVNGNLEGSISLPAGLKPHTRPGTYFGKRYNGNSMFKGWMDEVRISILNPTLLTYSDWANSYGLTGNDTNLTADLEYGGIGDGLNNLAEWAYGGNPLVDDADSVAPAYVGDEAEVGLAYSRLQGADELGVEYILETTTDLQYGSWTNEGIDESFVNASTEYQAVISTVAVDTAAEKFMRLFVESGPQSVTPPPVDLTAYEVPFAATTPTIDGVLTGTEYDDAHVIHLEFPSVTNSGSVSYQEASAPDFAVDYYLKWDATYLYVCVVVVDELLVFSANGTQAYPNDHMNVAIDPWRAGSGITDIAFYEMYRSESGASAIQYRSDTGVGDPALAPDNAVIDSSVQAGVGYTIEAAFAWADLGISSPAVGNKHRFLMFAADKDVATPDFGGIDEGNTGTFFSDSQGAGGSNSNVGDPTTYVDITLGEAL